MTGAGGMQIPSVMCGVRRHQGFILPGKGVLDRWMCPEGRTRAVNAELPLGTPALGRFFLLGMDTKSRLTWGCVCCPLEH